MPVLPASLAFGFDRFDYLLAADEGISQVGAYEGLALDGIFYFQFKGRYIPPEVKGMLP